MCTNTQHDEPFWFLHPVGIGLGITQLSYIEGFRRLDFVGGAVADEHRLASPFDNDLEREKPCQWSGGSWSEERRDSYVFAFRNCRQIDFDFGLGKHIGRGGHIDQKVYRRALNQRLSHGVISFNMN
jgi:hypothetical protein